ncbi:DNA-3-methyladenine glycosylase [Pelodytes ibericus]
MLAKRRRVQTVNDVHLKPSLGEAKEKGVIENKQQDVITSQYFQNDKIRLDCDFFNQTCTALAKALLGQVMLLKIRNNSLYSFLLSAGASGEGAAVLLRSLEPLEGLHDMRVLRNVRRGKHSKPIVNKELCNGPSKLCQAMSIEKSFDRRDLATDKLSWLEAGPNIPEQDIVSCARIGIGCAGEWTHKPLRFYVKGNKYVSVRDKTAEATLMCLNESTLSYSITK